MMTDPIADMLTRIRNAAKVGIREVTIPYSSVKFAIAKILETEKYLSSVEKVTPRRGIAPEFKVTLSYDVYKKPTVRAIKRISKPGRRMYTGYTELPRVANDYGIAIISTPKGMMTNKEARRQKLGGEIICEVY